MSLSLEFGSVFDLDFDLFFYFDFVLRLELAFDFGSVLRLECPVVLGFVPHRLLDFGSVSDVDLAHHSVLDSPLHSTLKDDFLRKRTLWS